MYCIGYNLLKVDGIQSLGGTGSLRIGMDLLHNVLGYETVFVSRPTWRKLKQGIFWQFWRLTKMLC